MTVRDKRIVFGTIAAASAAYLGLDATLFRPSNYPLAHKLFGDDWEIWRNLTASFATMATAAFGYLTANVGRNGNGSSHGTTTPQVRDDQTKP